MADYVPHARRRHHGTHRGRLRFGDWLLWLAVADAVLVVVFAVVCLIIGIVHG